MPDSDVSTSAYRVLARKYRPESFDGLIGQEAMVKTLTNAIRAGRLAHAFVLTGVRGVGKTTAARILARALNCVGPDGKGGMTAEPCGQCAHCQAIAEGNHVDVLEMDAASRTGVENIRELLDGVRYRPAIARMKVYIIDEVHMLSTQAFNALLKTLEEPPPHVTFIFATTETRKVPVTVLSRCQRFDLRRVDAERLAQHFKAIAEKEGATVEAEALQLIARVADGSVRDGLSVLDQAIAFGALDVTAEMVREMLGLADRMRHFDIFDALMGGDIARALDELGQAYSAGADPVSLLQDLLELTHWLTRIKVVPATAAGFGVPEAERSRGTLMAEKLSLAQLARIWQMLLKGVGEARVAASALQAAEMILIRLAYAADLPDPAELVKKLGEKLGEKNTNAPSLRKSAAPSPASSSPAPTTVAMASPRLATSAAAATLAATASAPAVAAPVAELAPAANAPCPMPTSFSEMVALFRDRREALLHTQLVSNVHLVRFEPGRLEIHLDARASANLANRLGELLSEWTATRWIVIISREDGEPTLREQAAATEKEKFTQAAKHPLVCAVRDAFPGATIEAVRDAKETLQATEADAAPSSEQNGDATS